MSLVHLTNCVRVVIAAGVLVPLAVATEPVSAAPASAILNADVPGTIPDSYIVVFKEGVSTSDIDGVAARHGAEVRYRYSAALLGFAATMSRKQAERVAADPAVDHVSQDQVVTIATDQANPVYNLDRIDQRNEVLNSVYNYSTTASNVRAYVIDTGIRLTHNQFGGRATTGIDAVDGGSADDCHGHGTHVAGTLGGSTYGVAKAVQLVAVRVFDCVGNGSVSRVISGVDWVTANGVRPAVANMSLRFIGNIVDLNTAVQRSINAGITYVVAAGNDDINACGVSPAMLNAAITVGATDRNDLRAGFSNFGACVDIFAPGVAIKSAWWTSNTATNTIEGTSMSSPHVAGVAALWLATHPTATPAQVHNAIVIDYSTKGLVRDPQGSPNRLLYRPKDPNVASLSCRSDPPQTLTCTMTHAHTTGTVSIRWFLDGNPIPGTNDRTSIQGNCFVSVQRVRVTISAGNGSDFSEDIFTCEFNG